MSNVILRPRRGTASQWSSANPVLAEGEIGIEVPSGGVGTGIVKMKFGDGSTAWNSLPYAVEDVSVVQNLDVESTTKVPSVSAVKSAIDELGESVAEGKALIASAITNKGVTTASNATFETMASNINGISSSNDIQIKQRTGYSYYGSQGNVSCSNIIIPNNGWKTIIGSNNDYVQYNSVYDADTGTRLVLNCTSELDISSVANIQLYQQLKNTSMSQSLYGQTIWTLKK